MAGLFPEQQLSELQRYSGDEAAICNNITPLLLPFHLFIYLLILLKPHRSPLIVALAACDENEERFAHLGQLLRVSVHLIWLSQGSEEQAAASLILPRADASAAANFCLLQRQVRGRLLMTLHVMESA